MVSCRLFRNRNAGESLRTELFPQLHLSLGPVVGLLGKFSKCYGGIPCVIHGISVG